MTTEQRTATVVTNNSHARPRPNHTDIEPLVAFTADQVIRLTGLTERQLRYWDRTGFFIPSYVGNRRGTPYGRIYLYRDVVGLRAIAILRNEHRVPLQELRRVGEYLKQHYDDPWSSLRFFVSGRHVFFKDPSADIVLKPGYAHQAVLPIEMHAVESDTRARALRLRERAPEEIGKITRHRNVESNAWVLAGTRVPTSAVWEFHEAGYDTDTILAAYPSLITLDVRQAIEFERQRRRKQAS